jgi:hypothetical protein
MAIKQELGELLNKKMDRKDFLKVIGVGLVAATGLSTALRAIVPPAQKSTPVASAQGDGSSVYGGTKAS